MPFASSTPRPNTRLYALLLAATLILSGVGLGALVAGNLTRKTDAVQPSQMVQAPAETPPSSLVQAPAETAPSKIVQAPAETTPPKIVEAPATAPATDDIQDYLHFVRDFETKKQAVISKKTADATMLLAQANGLKASLDEHGASNTITEDAKKANSTADDFNTMAADFEKRTPPAACQQLHDKYYAALGKTQQVMVAVDDVVSKMQGGDAQGALGAAMSLQGSASNDVDSAWNAADDALAEVCSKYHLKKEFTIRSDSGGSSGLGSLMR